MGDAPLPDSWQVLPLRTQTLPPATHTNAAIVGRSQVLVVDPGASNEGEQRRLEAALMARLDDGAELVGVFLTHHHPDHVSGLTPLRRALAERGVNAPVYAHALTFSELTLDLRAEEVCELVHGDVIDLGAGLCLSVWHTPGHTRGHLALFDEGEGVLYGGDIVASKGTIIINPPEGDMAAYLDSLSFLLRRQIRVLIPSHGAPIADVQAHLNHYIEHRLRREQLVLSALGQSPLRPEDLLPSAYPEISVALYPFAVRSLMAHLIKLKDDGIVVQTGGQWMKVSGA